MKNSTNGKKKDKENTSLTEKGEKTTKTRMKVPESFILMKHALRYIIYLLGLVFYVSKRMNSINVTINGLIVKKVYM